MSGDQGVVSEVKPHGGRRVLVVDDDPVLRLVLVGFLEDSGCCVCEAENGLEALDRLQDFDPEAIILDVNMPFLDGFGVLARMHELKLDIRTLMLTARDDHDDVRRSIGLGACDYLAKPFNSRQLATKVSHLLSKTTAPPPPR